MHKRVHNSPNLIYPVGTQVVTRQHVMHLIRLLLSGVTVLREGFVPVQVGDYREALLQIKAGDMPWDEV
jgi:hypothetical protein